jgi:hypothetical protein
MTHSVKPTTAASISRSGNQSTILMKPYHRGDIMSQQVSPNNGLAVQDKINFNGTQENNFRRPISVVDRFRRKKNTVKYHPSTIVNKIVQDSTKNRPPTKSGNYSI